MIKDYQNTKDSPVPPHPERSRRAGGGGGVRDNVILVFKTNLSNAKHIRKVKPSLNLHPYIKDWNVDLHDCDKILRVVSENIPAKEIEQMILDAGYLCEELN